MVVSTILFSQKCFDPNHLLKKFIWWLHSTATSRRHVTGALKRDFHTSSATILVPIAHGHSQVRSTWPKGRRPNWNTGMFSLTKQANAHKMAQGSRNSKKRKTSHDKDALSDNAVAYKSNRRGIKSKRGDSKISKDVPLDVLVEIFRLLEPVDLLHLSRVSKSLHDLLSSNDMIFLWKLVSLLSSFLETIPSLWPRFTRILPFNRHPVQMTSTLSYTPIIFTVVTVRYKFC